MLKDQVLQITDKIKYLEENQIKLNETLIEHIRTTTSTTTSTTTTINPNLILEGPVSIQKLKFIRSLNSSTNYLLSFEFMASSTSSSYALGLISMTIQILYHIVSLIFKFLQMVNTRVQELYLHFYRINLHGAFTLVVLIIRLEAL